MFAKPYKLKSNNTLKNSEKKHLSQRIQDEFPMATEEKVKEIIPVKGSCICMKIVLHSEDIVNVYAVDGVPTLIETSEGLVPTVCALWKVPDLVPMLNIHTPVLSKVQGGAPLYLPGVSLPVGGVGFPMFPCGTILAAHTEDNAAACIVGRAAMSSADMLLRASGVCLDTLHFYGDQLFKDTKFNKMLRPKLSLSESTSSYTVNLASHIQQLSIKPSQEQWPALGKQEWPSLSQSNTAPAAVPNEPRLIPADPVTTDQCGEADADDTVLSESCQLEDGLPPDMDGLLRWCLLTFLKLEGKTVELPLKTNLLYKNHMQRLCPPERTIDIKKSTYKKLSKFLEAMQREGLVEVRELERGVAAVVAVSAAHPLVRGHAPGARPATPPPEGQYRPPLVREMFCVTAHVQPLFAPVRKGTALTPSEVRATLTEYVKSKNLTSPHSRGAVMLDPLLAKILGRPEQECVKWDALTTQVQGAMTASTELQFGDGTVKLCKTRLEPVRMQVVVRSGNKKVTLVSNLQPFGLWPSSLARECQVGAAATCGVWRAPLAAHDQHDQLMLQGDQTHFVAKLLIEKYGLPKKFLEGADKALNKKK